MEYEVFLSFRGPDVRANFVDFLYRDLDRSKIRTFLDDVELRKGEEIAPSLVKAIEESKVYIPILSQNYASSKWCLRELALMMKCRNQGNGHIILPIFYMMAPRDVRHQEGSYKEAFRQHANRYKMETVNEWKDALGEVGNMKGWHVTESDRQGAIIGKVFTEVWSHLMSNYMLVTDELIGIESHVEKVTRLLSSDSEGVRIVGIHGMGGIGKTTIAKAVYNGIFGQFDRFWFLEDAREVLSKSNGVVTLQSMLISSILRTDYKVKDASEGLRVIKDRVCQHKVLVVLDNVNDSFEFDKILGKWDEFSSGSRFIVTTRDKRFNERNEFLMHDHIRDLGIAVIREENNQHPWKRSRIWSNEDALEMLKDEEGSDQVEVLRVNMEEETLELTDEQFKKLTGLRYLEVFSGRLTGDFKGVLPNLRWLKLHNCSSIPSDLNMKKLVILDMHDCPVNDDWNAWTGIQAAQKLKAVSLSFCGALRKAPDLSQCRTLESIHFWNCREMGGELHIGNFKSLKLLSLTMTKITKLTGKIRMLKNLEEIDAVHLRELPSGINRLSSLKILTLTLKEVAILPTSLKKLSLSSSQVPNLSELTDLEELSFDRCDQLQLPADIWKLSKLKTLKIWDSSYLITLNGLENLFRLTTLTVENCPMLEKLPSISKLESLHTVEITSCQVLSEIQDLSDLQNMEQLSIFGCTRLTKVNGFDKLKLLKSLSLSDCTSMKELPDLSGLKNLKYLNIDGCTQLVDIKGQIVGLEGLELLKKLSMRGCESIEKLPSLSGLKHVLEIDLSRCRRLTEVVGIEKLESLKILLMVDCESITKLPDLSCLKHLWRLEISGCTQLTEVKGLESLEFLESLSIEHCTSLRKSVNVSGLRSLKKLTLIKCTLLSEVAGLEELVSLQKLKMRDCTSIKELPNVSCFEHLIELDISGCTELIRVGGIESLKKLVQLRIDDRLMISPLKGDAARIKRKIVRYQTLGYLGP
ncbi:Disease resistance protein L6 [Linum grandiflorum]